MEAYELSQVVNHGKHWDGFKLVTVLSVRKYTDENAIAESAEAAGYADIYDRRLITLACGYNGSVGALKAMGALRMGLAEHELKPIVDV